MLIESHRGWATRFPENTMAAFAGAQAEGYDMIELDLRVTADGFWVILHDPTINRTARDASGHAPEEKLSIAEITLAQALSYEYGSWFSPEFSGEKLPELHDVLAFALEKKIPLKFDNVWQVAPAHAQASFLSAIAHSPARNYCGLTCRTIAAVKSAVAAIPDVNIHYDGPWDSDTKRSLMSLVPKNRLTVWRRLDNPHTSWCDVPPVTVEDAADIHTCAALGLWLLKKPEELALANMFGADIIETDGSLRPNAPGFSSSAGLSPQK